MGLEKAIEHGKEKRHPYRGVRAYDGTCRNHGACSRCEGTRLYQQRRLLEQARDEEKAAAHE